MAGSNFTRPSICDERSLYPGTFESWFPYYNHLLQPITASCFQKLHDNPQAWGVPTDWDSIPNCPSVSSLVSCIQDDLPSQVTLAMASAQVILGLTPTLISAISPSIGEISMLSASRPILSFMISLGSPAVFSTRSLEYDDPIGVLKKPTRGLLQAHRVTRPDSRHMWISAVEYFVVFLAIVNVLTMDGQLGYQTPSVWKLGAVYLVYLWSTFAIIPHGISAIAFYYTKTMRAERKANRQRREAEDKFGTWHARFKREVTICAAKRRRNYLEHAVEEPFWVRATNISASFMAYLLLFYGTILFPSLLFISTIDAFSVIMRYFSATFICRLVLAYELSGIAAVEADRAQPSGHPEYKPSNSVAQLHTDLSGSRSGGPNAENHHTQLSTAHTF